MRTSRKSMLLAERLKTCREAHGLTQKQLGEMSGVSQYTINHLELGKIKRPKAQKIKAIAVALGVNCSVFLEHECLPQYADERTKIMVDMFSRCTVSDQENLIAFARHLAEKHERLKDI